MNRPKAKTDTVPSGFTLSLALTDAIPVLFFCASMILIALRFQSILFFTGAALCLFAGTAKVLWKIIVVLKQKDIRWLFRQMRTMMPAGFLLMLLSVILHAKRIDLSGTWQRIASFPAAFFFLLGLIGMGLMILFALTLDSRNAKANWIEQTTNGIAQASIFIGILLMK